MTFLIVPSPLGNHWGNTLLMEVGGLSHREGKILASFLSICYIGNNGNWVDREAAQEDMKGDN